jgi:hypothetical protein
MPAAFVTYYTCTWSSLFGDLMLLISPRAPSLRCQANVWVAIFGFIGNYFWTHYFFNLLGAAYTLPSHRLNGVRLVSSSSSSSLAQRSNQRNGSTTITC